MIQLVIFDFDGTIVDTAPDIVAATNEFLHHYGHGPLENAEIVRGIGMGLKELLRKVVTTEGIPAEIEDHFMEIYERHHLLQAQPFPGLKEFLENWPHRAAILSNKSERFIHSILRHLKLDQYPWSSIVGGDTFAHKKPHPLPFENVMAAAGVTTAETVMVGDGEPDILGAANSGLRSIAAGYGYCPLEQLRHLGADFQIAHLKELQPLLHRLDGGN